MPRPQPPWVTLHRRNPDVFKAAAPCQARACDSAPANHIRARATALEQLCPPARPLGMQLYSAYVYIYVFITHNHRMGAPSVRACDSAAVHHVHTRSPALEELQHDSATIRTIIISSILISSIGIAESIHWVKLDLKSMIQDFVVI